MTTTTRLAVVVATVLATGCSSSPSPRGSSDGGKESDATLVDGSGGSSDGASTGGDGQSGNDGGTGDASEDAALDIRHGPRTHSHVLERHRRRH